MHIPFFWQFNLCNVTQAVVDKILQHILTQVTLNALNKINAHLTKCPELELLKTVYMANTAAG